MSKQLGKRRLIKKRDERIGTNREGKEDSGPVALEINGCRGLESTRCERVETDRLNKGFKVHKNTSTSLVYGEDIG
jgi:hypothetical protein